MVISAKSTILSLRETCHCHQQDYSSHGLKRWQQTVQCTHRLYNFEVDKDLIVHVPKLYWLHTKVKLAFLSGMSSEISSKLQNHTKVIEWKWWKLLHTQEKVQMKQYVIKSSSIFRPEATSRSSSKNICNFTTTAITTSSLTPSIAFLIHYVPVQGLQDKVVKITWFTRYNNF